MGNSVRSSLGNLCGGQQGTADFSDEDRPVAKPKESKKKDKKSKKLKKEKNGDLPPIEESPGDRKPETETVDKEKEISKDEVSKEAEAEKTIPTPTPQEQTKEQDESVKEDQKTLSVYDDADEPSAGVYLGDEKREEELPVETPSIPDLEDEKGEEELKVEKPSIPEVISEETETCDENKTIIEEVTVSDNILELESSIPTEDFGNKEAEIELSNDSMYAPENVKDIGLYYINEVKPIQPEEIGIAHADDIFVKSSKQYAPFCQCIEKLKKALIEFRTIVDPPDELDLECCMRRYDKLLKNESQQQDSTSQVDISEANASLQNLRSTGIIVLQEIEQVRPELNNSIENAGNIDIIDYVKGKIIEGDQLGITSKFSAPGKCRRNMMQLKKSAKLLNKVEEEVNNIMDLIEKYSNQDEKSIEIELSSSSSIEMPEDDSIIAVKSKTSVVIPMEYDEESVIIPSPVKADDSDLFEKLSKLPQPENVPESIDNDEKHNEESYTTSEPIEISPAPGQLPPTLLAQASSNDSRPESPEVRTYIIESIPEESPQLAPKTSPQEVVPEVGPKLVFPSASLPKSRHSSMKTPTVTQVVVDDEDHNMLDFGKYVFVDPSTGDIQVMRNRSRSLDSLVSMASNRSSISRFGSFELVTDFEINIAEKNQQNL